MTINCKHKRLLSQEYVLDELAVSFGSLHACAPAGTYPIEGTKGVMIGWYEIYKQMAEKTQVDTLKIRG